MLRAKSGRYVMHVDLETAVADGGVWVVEKRRGNTPVRVLVACRKDAPGAFFLEVKDIDETWSDPGKPQGGA